MRRRKKERVAMKLVNLTQHDITVYDSLGNIVRLPVKKPAYSKADIPTLRGGTFYIIENSLVPEVKHDDNINFMMATATDIGQSRDGEQIYSIKDLSGYHVILTGLNILTDKKS